MRYFFVTAVSETEVTEEQYREAYLTSPTYFKRCEDARNTCADEDLPAALEQAAYPTEWRNGLLSGRIEQIIIDVEAK